MGRDGGLKNGVSRAHADYHAEGPDVFDLLEEGGGELTPLRLAELNASDDIIARRSEDSHMMAKLARPSNAPRPRTFTLVVADIGVDRMRISASFDPPLDPEGAGDATAAEALGCWVVQGLETLLEGGRDETARETGEGTGGTACRP